MKPSGGKRVALVLLAGMTVVWSTSSYGEDKADTTRSMTRLSAKAANAKARQDLLSILQPTDKFTQGNRARVSGMAMDTVPYGAGFKGLCRRDELILVYGSTVKRRNSSNDPLRPVGVVAEPQFRVARGPVTAFSDGFEQQAAWNDDDCRKLQSDKSAPWFSAADAREAARGVNVLLAATTAIRSGRLKVQDCRVRLNGQICEDWVLKLGQLAEMTEVKEDCPAGPGQKCYTMHFIEAIELTVVASFGDDDSVNPKIESVSAAEYVLVT